MQNGGLRCLLNKAKELEKKYEWFQAAKIYEEASNLALNKKNILNAAGFHEKTGFCFYRAAMQAKTNNEFRNRLKQSIQAYKKISIFFEEKKDEAYRVGIKHANALVAYTKSWLKADVLSKNKLLSEWWTLENQILLAYERAGDTRSIGKVCNDLMEYSNYKRCWIASEYSEWASYLKEGMTLAEKAIRTLSKTDDDYELARAYCFASWYYSWSGQLWKSSDKITQANQKCQNYAKKALDFSQKTEDAWLISWSNISAWNAAQFCNANPALSMQYSQEALKYGRIAKDNYVIGFGNCLTSWSINILAKLLEDPDKQKESYQKALKMAQEATHNFQIIGHVVGFQASYPHYSGALSSLASIESSPKAKQALFEKAIAITQEGLERLKGRKNLQGLLFYHLTMNLLLLSETKSESEEKLKVLKEAQLYGNRALDYAREWTPFDYLWQSRICYHLASVQNGLAKIETNSIKRIEQLNTAVHLIENCIELAEKRRKFIQSPWASGFHFGQSYEKLGGLLQQIYFLNREKKRLIEAIVAYKKATTIFERAKLPTYVAESHWHAAQLNHDLGNYQEASKEYESASQAYELASKKISQLKDLYKDLSLYMRAWSQIEQARFSHSIENYEEAQHRYNKAATFHESTSSWSYLTQNYLAWANMEGAEGLSRKENTQQAKKAFQKALQLFAIAEESIKQKLEETATLDEKEMILRLLKASELRHKYCQARILMEEAKLLDSKGKYLQSSKSYAEAVENISTIIDMVDVEAERKELEYLAVLCQAWEKMAIAEEQASSESYLEAAEIFERARDYCYTRRASLWAIGNSSFCKGLAAGTRYQDSLDLKETVMAKRYMTRAATMYQQAGFKNAAEYAKATQRLFDAYIFMNKGESEADPEKRAKQYQMAENLLQIAASSFIKAKQPEKTAQLEGILATVREEKTLAISLNDVMHAPASTSSTMSFTAPAPTSESSVGLESFEHANVQANLVVGLKEVRVGESFCLSVEFVNAGKEPALLTKVADFIPPGFVVAEKPEIYRLENSCLNMKGKQIAPLKLVEAKVILQPSKKGIYHLNPKVHYLDENGRNKSLQLKSVEIKVEEIVLANRVSTGTKELDALLLGGIPEEYAVVLTGAPTDERELVIKNFLEAGTGEGITSFYAATEADGLENLLGKPNFYLFLCNPKPKVRVPDLPNVYKLHGKADINNLNIALVKAQRTVEQSSSKRICINIVSDVLANYSMKTTRKWIAELTTDLISKGFTILAVINPQTHTPEELGNILELFDGEISLTQIGDPLERKKALIIKNLRGQDYIKNPICLT